MYLQLAESSVKTKIAEFYIPYPDKQGNPVLIREDFMDDLSDQDYEDYMDMLEGAGVQMGGKRRDERKKRREERKQAKTQKKEAKTAIKTAKAGAITAGTWQGAGSKLLTGIESIAGNIFGGADDASKISGSVDFGTPEEKKPPYLLYGVGAVLILGTVYFITRPKAHARR